MEAATPDTSDLAPLLLFTGMLLISVLLGHAVHQNQFKYANEGSLSLLVGLLAGGGFALYFAIVHHDFIPKTLFEFNSNVFFNILLPPIIFNAGFSVKKKDFFQNFLTLMLCGIVGTFMSVTLISFGSYLTLSQLHISPKYLDVSTAIALACILSSTDSVAVLQILNADTMPLLYNLVFGEGVVNDATSIVLLGASQHITSEKQLTPELISAVAGRFAYLFVCSLLLGIAVGLFSAIVVRYGFWKHSTDREVLFVGLTGFMAYALAQLFDLSGIFAVFFCGITMSHYTWHSLNPSAKIITIYCFRLLSYAAENTLFIYCGVATWSKTTMLQTASHDAWLMWGKVGRLAGSLLVQLLLSRALWLSAILAAANLWRSARIGWRQGLIIWWAGLMRGAISIALTFEYFYDGPPHTSDMEREIIVTATVLVVALTTIGGGALTRPFIDLLMPNLGGTAPARLDTIFRSLAETPDEDLQEPNLNLVGGPSEPLLTNGEDRRRSPFAAQASDARKRSWLHRIWRKFDKAVLSLVFGGRGAPPPFRHRQTSFLNTNPLILDPNAHPQVYSSPGEASMMLKASSTANMVLPGAVALNLQHFGNSEGDRNSEGQGSSQTLPVTARRQLRAVIGEADPSLSQSYS